MKSRVAIVGGGIAGISCAWGLHKSGKFDVDVFENQGHIGGNAKIHDWKCGVSSGLSVLAWPFNLFHSYNELLRQLGIEWERVDLKYFVETPDGEVFAHGFDTALRRSLRTDFVRWSWLVWFVNVINEFCRRMFSTSKSVYGLPAINPMNFISLKLLCRIFFISRRFWHLVIVPIHSSTFLTIRIDKIPAVISPLLEKVLSLSDGATMASWAEGHTSAEVFKRMIAGFEDSVHLNCEISNIEFVQEGNTRRIAVHASGKVSVFDHLVFACSAPSAARLLPASRRLDKNLLARVEYVEDADRTLVHGFIHTDTSVLPETHRERLLREHCNYVKLHRNGDVTNTFILSSWSPALRHRPPNTHMMVSYNLPKIAAPHPSKIEADISHIRAHPELSTRNLALCSLLHLRQGIDGIYFCGSYTTPGNGHDLSLLSGLAVAETIGARFPFDHNPLCGEDMGAIRGIMFGKWGVGRGLVARVYRLIGHLALVAVLLLSAVRLL